MLKYILLIILFVFSILNNSAQNKIVFSPNNQIYARISGNAYLTIDESDPSAITTSSVANIISEGEYNAIKWKIGNNTGNYTIPFTTNSLVKIPLKLNITNGGNTSNGEIIFSTYETNTDKNTNYPSDVTTLNSNCKDSMGLYAIDRFWRIEATNYTTKPGTQINFGYNANTNEIANTNTITETALKAQRFNNNINSWETPQKLYGIANTISKNIEYVSVLPNDFYKSWTLIDSSVLILNISITSSSLTTICEGKQAIVSATGATSYTLYPNNISSNSNFSISPTSTSSYSIIGSIGSGSNTCNTYSNSALIFTVAVNAKPDIIVNSTPVTCYGFNDGAISANITANSAFTFTWSNGSQAGAINQLSAGIYTLQVEDNILCSNSTTIMVSEPLPISIIELENVASCDNKNTGAITILNNGGTSPYSILWDNNKTTNTLNEIAAGVLTATITDNNNCIQIYSSIINEVQCIETIIPQIFTPNADGKNDLFFINSISYYPNNKLYIYNRWGNLVYSKSKYNNEFDGTANVSEATDRGILPSGTYFVLLDFGDGITPNYSGYLELQY